MLTIEHDILCRRYREAKHALTAISAHLRLSVRQRFPVLGFAVIKSGTADVCEVAIVQDVGCPADKLPCLFENGNVWWKDVADLEPLAAKAASQTIRRALLKHKGYTLAGAA